MVVLSLRNDLVTFSSNQHDGSDQNNDQGDCRKDHHGRKRESPFRSSGVGSLRVGWIFSSSEAADLRVGSMGSAMPG